MSSVDIEDYLKLVVAKAKEAASKDDWAEVARILRLCSDALLEKARQAEEMIK